MQGNVVVGRPGGRATPSGGAGVLGSSAVGVLGYASSALLRAKRVRPGTGWVLVTAAHADRKVAGWPGRCDPGTSRIRGVTGQGIVPAEWRETLPPPASNKRRKARLPNR